MKGEGRRRVGAVVTGGKFVDPATGYRYWWPDEAAAPVPVEPLGPEWQSVGYTTDSTDPVVTADDCPECRQGKHQNCAEVAFDADDNPVPCPCAEGGHL